MKNIKITFFSSGIITLVIVFGLIHFYYNNNITKDTAYTVDESKYMYAKFLEEKDNKSYNIYFIIPKGYEYEKFEEVDEDYSDEVYHMTLLSDENNKYSFRTCATILIEYFLTKENTEKTSLFPESRVERSYPNFISLTDIPSDIIKVKLLAKNYAEFMEKQYLLFIETDKYIMCLNVDLPYRYPYSTDEEIVIYFTDLLKSLKIEEL